jgi:hypothetical protein
MIGGTDIVVPNPGLEPGVVLNFVVKSIFDCWPEAVAQDVQSGEQFHSFSRIPFSPLRELFVYQDIEALGSWERLGADPSNQNSMLHVIADKKELTMVVDDASAAAMKFIFERVMSFIDHSSLFCEHEVA